LLQKSNLKQAVPKHQKEPLLQPDSIENKNHLQKQNPSETVKKFIKYNLPTILEQISQNSKEETNKK